MTAPLDRRDFLRTTGGTLGLLLSRNGLSAAQTPSTEPPAGPPVAIGVVGLGAWGREILAALGRTPAARVDWICESYEPFLKRSSASAPRAQTTTDWRRLVDAPVQAIVVATPTGAHREIAVAALEAGKHVYCEAPLAASIDEARFRPASRPPAALKGCATAGFRFARHPFYPAAGRPDESSCSASSSTGISTGLTKNASNPAARAAARSWSRP